MKIFEDPAVSVIIPTLNAEKELPELLRALEGQNYPITEIIIVDSDSVDQTVPICKLYPKIKLIQIKREEFDHGKTRDMAFRKSIGDVVVFLTQDAIPANEKFIEKIIAPLSDNNIALSTGRQIPKKNASKEEYYIRLFNYPEESYILSKEDLKQKGIKTFRCSDVCAAYKRNIYYELGGFDYPLKTNEDMFFAAKAINAGYQIAYAADALVYHSHNFTLQEQFKRHFYQGYEIERHRDLLHHASSNAEGLKLMQFVSLALWKKGEIISWIRFVFDSLVRWLAHNVGRVLFLMSSTISL